MGMTQTSKLIDATALYLIGEISEPSGASVRMFRDVQAFPLAWGSVLAGKTYRARTCCASTDGDVHNRECQTEEAFASWRR